MEVRVSKWGNSLAIRLPAKLAAALGLKEGDRIDVRPAGHEEPPIVEIERKLTIDELFERVDPRGKPYIWIGTLRGEADVADDTDIHVVFNGGISVTPVYLDLTHTPTLQTLRQAFV